MQLYACEGSRGTQAAPSCPEGRQHPSRQRRTVRRSWLSEAAALHVPSLASCWMPPWGHPQNRAHAPVPGSLLCCSSTLHLVEPPLREAGEPVPLTLPRGPHLQCVGAQPLAVFSRSVTRLQSCVSARDMSGILATCAGTSSSCSGRCWVSGSAPSLWVPLSPRSCRKGGSLRLSGQMVPSSPFSL